MKSKTLYSLMALLLVLTGCGGEGNISTDGEQSSQAAIDEAFAVIGQLYDNEAPDDEKLAASVAFLEMYPESEYTLGLVGDVLYFRGHQAGDMEGSIEFAEQIRSAVTDATIARKFDQRLISWYAMAGMKEKMLSIADRFEQEGSVRFGDYFNVIEGAVEMEEWALAREYCAKAQLKANAATWRAEWPDVEATDEEAEAAGLNRQGMLLVKDSWARANLGDVDGALDGFARADEFVDRSYLGIPEYDLNRYWGRASVMRGDFEGAMEKFAPDALIVGDDGVVAELKQAYVEANGSEDGYEPWACGERLGIAKTADEFELPDLGGGRHRFADLRGEVTLLNFWSPT